jgi:hypothetical protein
LAADPAGSVTGAGNAAAGAVAAAVVVGFPRVAVAGFFFTAGFFAGGAAGAGTSST